MKKKILILTLCFTTLFNSLFLKPSNANPLALAKLSIVYSIGRIALDCVGFVGDISDVIEFGSNIYGSMTKEEQKQIEDNIVFDDKGFKYNDSILDIIKPYSPNKKFHYVTGLKASCDKPNIYHNDSTNVSDSLINSVFESNKKTRIYQGVNFEYMIFTTRYDGTDKIGVSIYYKLPNINNDIQTAHFEYYHPSQLHSVDLINLELTISSISNGKAKLKLIINRGSNLLYETIIASLDESCSNCPHNNLQPSYNYPTNEELEYIENKYPNIENDISDKINNSNGGGSNGGGSNGGGSNNPIISNPPTFPNLQEFDFSALQLEPLTNLFSNFTTKFPFSLPFDLVNLISGLVADPVPPIFETEFLGETMVLDFTEFEELANLIRMFTLLGYVVSLIFVTKRFGG